eukprot:TRINITY_DN3195_c0_g1_i1.p1 TRINITY_DN3195_c0_g1~~TRINITY_DN3195_c0_g1_i1.p1  ORF type:complete len:135 (-),score=31.47 TRINITY_DN3195_c0_g1_i1:45-449(-)
MSENELIKHDGSCHCSAIQFQVFAPKIVNGYKCNCTICTVKATRIHFIVPASRFQLIKGSEYITTYTFNTHQAKHTFCKICGVQAFYTPRSNPDGRAISPFCINSNTIEQVKITKFDGQNWEREILNIPKSYDN